MTGAQRQRMLNGAARMIELHGDLARRDFASQRELASFRDEAEAERVWAHKELAGNPARGALGAYIVFMDDIATALNELVEAVDRRPPSAPLMPGPAGPQSRVAAVVKEGLPRLREYLEHAVP